jgi:hypothetical protein
MPTFVLKCASANGIGLLCAVRNFFHSFSGAFFANVNTSRRRTPLAIIEKLPELARLVVPSNAKVSLDTISPIE